VKTSKARSRSGMTRRESVGAAPAMATFAIVPRHVLGGPGRKPPNDKLNIAGIGVSPRVLARHCTGVRSISPLRRGDEIEVIGMAPEDECQHEMFVMVRWDRKEGLGVPLAQLKPGSDADDATRQAVEDWLYWAKMGYEF
jgi:hypothetical protein